MTFPGPWCFSCEVLKILPNQSFYKNIIGKFDGKTNGCSLEFFCLTTSSMDVEVDRAKFPHSPILHYACRSLLMESHGKNNAIAGGATRCLYCFLVAKQRTTHM